MCSGLAALLTDALLVSRALGARRACLQRSQYLAGRPEEARAEGEKVGAAPPQRPMGKECAHYLSLSEIERADDVRFHAPLLQACATRSHPYFRPCPSP